MNKMEHALHELHEMDALAAQDSPIHRLSPLAKLLATVVYIVVTVSFHKYQLSGLAVMALHGPLFTAMGLSGESFAVCTFLCGYYCLIAVE